MRSLRVVLVSAVAALALAPPAQAANDDTSVTLTGGDLTYPTAWSADDFSGVTLNGLPQVVRTNVNSWKVKDARGGSGGWHASISATQFATSDNSKTLPTGALTLTTVAVPTTGATNLSVPPVPVPLAAAIDGGSTQKMATAASLTGLGEWTFTPTNTGGGDLILTVPPHALAGTYTSTVTTTVDTGP